MIPDLTKLSLAAARACVVLMGADVAHLERHGQQAQWQPNLCWLAGCASSEVGMVSPHLLDRFALRLSGRVTKTTDRTGEILRWIDRQTSEEETKSESLPAEICDRLHQATQHRVAIADKARARILDYISTLEVYSPRREIALARLAVANARLEGVAEVTVDRVDAAARMMGLKPVFTGATNNPRFVILHLYVDVLLLWQPDDVTSDLPHQKDTLMFDRYQLLFSVQPIISHLRQAQVGKTSCEIDRRCR